MAENSQSAPPRPFVYDPPAEPFLEVIYVDDCILVLGKQAGLLTVPGKDPALADCIETRARSIYPEARIVHRLDKDTSGVMVLGLTAPAHANLGLQFEKRQTQKSYTARVWGIIEHDEGTIDAPIITDWPNRPKQKIDHELGRSAVTEWKVISRNDETTRVKLFPQTGRTHQLRLHMLHLGHPILGDNLYAHTDALNAAHRLQLHADDLSFTHPKTRTRCFFETACPF